MKCNCSYKCRHGSDGFAWVCRRTWHNHQRLSAAGKVHSCIKRSLEGRRASQKNGTTGRVANGWYVICTCDICIGKEWRSRDTVAKHMRQQLLRGHLYSRATCLVTNPSAIDEDSRFSPQGRLLQAMDNIRKNEEHFENANVQGNGEVGPFEANDNTGEKQENLQ